MGFSWRSIHPESFHIELLSGCRLSRVFGKQHVPVNNEKKYWYFVSKIVLTCLEKKSSIDNEKFFKFEAEGQEI